MTETKTNRGEELNEASIHVASDKTPHIFIFGRENGDTMVARMDDKGKIINDEKAAGDKPMATSAARYTLAITGQKDVTIDLKSAPDKEIIIDAEGRDSKKTTLTHFDGHPPVYVEDGGVSVKASAGEAFGFRARANADGKMEVTSNIQLAKDDKGNILVQRDGKTIMTVEKDARADFRDKDGNVLFTIDGKEGLKTNQEKLQAAEKAAFKHYMRDIKGNDPDLRDPDLARETLVLKESVRVGDPARPQPAAAQAKAEGNGILGSTGSLGRLAAAELAPLKNQLQQSLMSAGTGALTKATGLPPIGPGRGKV